MIIAKVLKKTLDLDGSDAIFSSNYYPAVKKDGEVTFLEEYGRLNEDELNLEILHLMSEKQQIEFKKDKEMDFSIDLKDHSRFRVNCFVQKKGFAAVFRPIKEVIPSFDDLGIPNKIKDFTNKKSGLVLITGGVGSGKSTTLAALVKHINENKSKHIITVENPIEYLFQSDKSLIEQREVGVDTHSFENGLKYALRQATDVIMVGEMRDLETIRLALRAAETGNLVLATLHTSGAARTISRVIDVFPTNEKDQIKQQLSESLIGVVWQDLLKKSEGEGRIPAIELLVNSRSISNMIRKGTLHQIDGVIETSKNEGMIPMKKSLEDLFSSGKISKEEYENSLENIKVL